MIKVLKEVYCKYLEYIPYWLSLSFWSYVLTSNKRNEVGLVNYFRSVKCRFKSHPCGVEWYNSIGLEPNMHCKNCGEDLG